MSAGKTGKVHRIEETGHKGEEHAGNDLWNRSGTGGPGAHDIKGGRLLREADAIAIPGKEKETCTAYQIALGAVPEIEEKEIIPVVFPMTKTRRC